MNDLHVLNPSTPPDRILAEIQLQAIYALQALETAHSNARYYNARCHGEVPRDYFKFATRAIGAARRFVSYTREEELAAAFPEEDES